MKAMFESCIRVLRNAHIILLVDWPGAEVPTALLKAGFMVISYSPGLYSVASLQADGAGNKKLVFTDLPTAPDQVDIVNIFRPEEEHAEIIAQHVLPLKAKAIWLQPPVTSIKTADFASEIGLTFVEGHDIAAMAGRLTK